MDQDSDQFEASFQEGQDIIKIGIGPKEAAEFGTESNEDSAADRNHKVQAEKTAKQHNKAESVLLEKHECEKRIKEIDREVQERLTELKELMKKNAANATDQNTDEATGNLSNLHITGNLPVNKNYNATLNPTNESRSEETITKMQ